MRVVSGIRESERRTKMKKLIVCLVLSTMMIGCAPTEQGVNYATIYSPAGDIIDEGFIYEYATGYANIRLELENGNEYFTSTSNVILDRRQGTAFSIYKEGEHDQ
jgi:hypothetical protein